MNNTKLLEATARVSLRRVWIAVSTPKAKGGKDIREFLAKCVDEGNTKTFILTQNTIRELRDSHSFDIYDACEVRDDTGCYECIKVDALKAVRKIFPKLVTRKAA